MIAKTVKDTFCYYLCFKDKIRVPMVTVCSRQPNMFLLLRNFIENQTFDQDSKIQEFIQRSKIEIQIDMETNIETQYRSQQRGFFPMCLNMTNVTKEKEFGQKMYKFTCGVQESMPRCSLLIEIRKYIPKFGFGYLGNVIRNYISKAHFEGRQQLTTQDLAKHLHDLQPTEEGQATNSFFNHLGPEGRELYIDCGMVADVYSKVFKLPHIDDKDWSVPYNIEDFNYTRLLERKGIKATTV
jgi:hypothetical protein